MTYFKLINERRIEAAGEEIQRLSRESAAALGFFPTKYGSLPKGLEEAVSAVITYTLDGEFITVNFEITD